MLPNFDYHRVQSISEAVQLLAACKGEAKILAGGTDLLLQMEQRNVWGKPCPKHLVSMRYITSLNYIRLQDGDIAIGANVTHREAGLSPLIGKELSALHDATCQVGSVQIRNVATIAGNLCNAAPSADTAAPLLALGAILKVVGPQSERLIALSSFYRGPGQTVLEPDEVLREICIPQRPALAESAYIKLARRKAMDLALLGVATYLCLEPDKSHVKEVRIGLNTAAPTPIRACKAEAVLKGYRLSDEFIEEAARIAATEASPRSSFRSTSEYRREMIRVFVLRSLRKTLERIQRVSHQQQRG
jgi:carbon-monoxide dehydrogenase medium subunit